jgi:RecA-family ATPase
MRALTIIQSLKPDNVGKIYSYNGSKLIKKAAAAMIEGRGKTVHVPDAKSLFELLHEITSSKNLVICNGVFRGAGTEEFLVFTEKRFLKIVEADGGDFKAIIGAGRLYRVKGGPLTGKLVGARLKALQEPSNWVLIDADEPGGFPEEWRPLSLQQRLELLEPVAPGISTAERVELRGSSARVVKRGEQPGQPSHAWICTKDADDMARAAVSLMVHATNAGVAFKSPRRSKLTQEIVGYSPRTSIDLATWHTGRLNFDSQPTVLAECYEVADAGITIVNPGGGIFQSRRVATVTADVRGLFEKNTGHRIEISGRGDSLRIYETSMLSLDTPIERRGETKPLRDWLEHMEANSLTKLRCEAPFRESRSEAAYIRHQGGNTFVYDSGTSTSHLLLIWPDGDDDDDKMSSDSSSGGGGGGGEMWTGDEMGKQESQDNVAADSDAAEVKTDNREMPNHQKLSHEMLEFVPFDPELRAPRCIIPGFIGEGVVIIAGERGLGKTTSILPLAAMAAHINKVLTDPLIPKEWRHVIYITEDVSQVQRILVGIANDDSQATERIQERIHIVEAKHMTSARFVEVGHKYVEMFTREVDDVKLLPLVVIDTKSAVFRMEDVNDNAEASDIINDLKQGFSDLPTWIIGHIAKALSRAGAGSMTLLGASAAENDAQQCLYLVKENDQRYLVRGKTRFEADWRELAIHSVTRDFWGSDEWGLLKLITVRHATFEPLGGGVRQKRFEEQKREAEAAEIERREAAVMAFVQEARERGEQVSKSKASGALGVKRQSALALVGSMIDDCRLVEVPIPKEHMRHFGTKSFLLDLDDEEQRAYLARGELPLKKLEQLQATWAALPTPSVSANTSGHGFAS